MTLKEENKKLRVTIKGLRAKLKRFESEVRDLTHEDHMTEADYQTWYNL